MNSSAMPLASIIPSEVFESLSVPQYTAIKLREALDFDYDVKLVGSTAKCTNIDGSDLDFSVLIHRDFNSGFANLLDVCAASLVRHGAGDSDGQPLRRKK